MTNACAGPSKVIVSMKKRRDDAAASKAVMKKYDANFREGSRSLVRRIDRYRGRGNRVATDREFVLAPRRSRR
jgi:hypothetical protein